MAKGTVLPKKKKVAESKPPFIYLESDGSVRTKREDITYKKINEIVFIDTSKQPMQFGTGMTPIDLKRPYVQQVLGKFLEKIDFKDEKKLDTSLQILNAVMGSDLWKGLKMPSSYNYIHERFQNYLEKLEPEERVQKLKEWAEKYPNLVKIQVDKKTGDTEYKLSLPYQNDHSISNSDARVSTYYDAKTGVKTAESVFKYEDGKASYACDTYYNPDGTKQKENVFEQRDGELCHISQTEYTYPENGYSTSARYDMTEVPPQLTNTDVYYGKSYASDFVHRERWYNDNGELYEDKVYFAGRDSRSYNIKKGDLMPAERAQRAAQLLAMEPGQGVQRSLQLVSEANRNIYVPFVDEKDGKTKYVKLSEAEISQAAKYTNEAELSEQDKLEKTVMIEVGGKTYFMTKDDFATLTAGKEHADVNTVQADMKNGALLAKQTRSRVWQDRWGRRWWGSYTVGGDLVREIGTRTSSGPLGVLQWEEAYYTGNKTARKENSTVNMKEVLRRHGQNTTGGQKTGGRSW